MPRPLLIALIGAMALTQTAHAQAIDAAARKSVVENAASAMRSGYVFPDIGAKAADALQKSLEAGEYDAITDNGALAERLTADLKKVAPDGHLSVRFAGAAPPADRPPPPPAEAGIVRADKLAGAVGYVEVVGFPPLSIMKPAADRAMQSLAGSRAIILDLRRNGGGSPEAVAYLASFFMDPAKRTPVNVFHSRRPGTTEVAVTETYNSPTPVSFFGKPL
ncbi:MAG: S41 family peptidase, partial [Caulobacter sp.]